ncbi:MAG: site-2 protease family protein [candidate division KSB1 bacterium]|nr:site-2 protease family protein [candidate division KSB1 bacterium]MDZ7368717.1 site-2 protease family protein [candidate division KSB1 bacterium]MDZ7406542.1 site-2 protease family protein [candidate division KSB1 bacterium]
MPDRDFGRFEPFHSFKMVETKPPVATRFLRADFPALNVMLFLLTCVSTFYHGYMSSPGNSFADGFWYGGGIITILLCHEMGHYLMCQRHGVRATLPFFIPFPVFSPFGTLGAVIRMDSRLPNRRVLFDIGVAGPLAGLVVTIPAIYFGLQMSEVRAVAGAGEGLTLGDSILFSGMSFLIKGPLAEGQDVFLHPLAYAGWVGLFVTALNLLPIGQLDGGHILYALMGERSAIIGRVALASFALMGIIVFQRFPGWVPFISLLLWFGHRHPSTEDSHKPLDSKRRALAYLSFAIFILAFTPIPFYL